MNRPWMKFHPGDWRRDPGLAIVSLAARAVWFELMGVMHDCAEYGVLEINGRAPTVDQIAVLVRAIPADVPKVGPALQELEDAGVYSRTDKGLIYSRRMVRDEALSDARAESGGKGAKSRWQTDGKRHGKAIASPRVRAGARGRVRADSDSDSESASRSRLVDAWKAVLDRPEFERLRADPSWVKAWADWIEHASSPGSEAKVPSGTQATKMFRKAIKVGLPLYVAAIELSIEHNWKGIDPSWVKPGTLDFEEAKKRSDAEREQTERVATAKARAERFAEQLPLMESGSEDGLRMIDQCRRHGQTNEDVIASLKEQIQKVRAL